MPDITLEDFNPEVFNPYYFSEPSNKTVNSIEPSKKEINSVKLSNESTTNIVSSNFDPNLGLMKEFVDIATEEGIPFRVTSGFRSGAVTSKGLPS